VLERACWPAGLRRCDEEHCEPWRVEKNGVWRVLAPPLGLSTLCVDGSTILPEIPLACKLLHDPPSCIFLESCEVIPADRPEAARDCQSPSCHHPVSGLHSNPQPSALNGFDITFASCPLPSSVVRAGSLFDFIHLLVTRCAASPGAISSKAAWWAMQHAGG
jgi:hypothetical protein